MCNYVSRAFHISQFRTTDIKTKKKKKKKKMGKRFILKHGIYMRVCAYLYQIVALQARNLFINHAESVLRNRMEKMKQNRENKNEGKKEKNQTHQNMHTIQVHVSRNKIRMPTIRFYSAFPENDHSRAKGCTRTKIQYDLFARRRS